MLAEINKEILEETEEENMETEIEDCDRYDIDIEFILTKVRNKFENSKTNLNVTYIDHNPNANELAYGNSAPNLLQMRQPPNYSNQKLPKLSLPHFDGNLLEWQTFWESFESSVHDNGTLSDIQKFSYLRNQLQGIAAQCIAGLPLTSANYYKAITIIRERFGQNHKIINAHIQSLMNLPAPKQNAESLRNFSDRLECSIRGLESLGTTEHSFGAILTPIIYNKLPSVIRMNITRDRGNDDWDISALREAIKKEVCIQSAGNVFNMEYACEQEVIPTASFVAGMSRYRGPRKDYQQNVQTQNKKCLFCEEMHHSNACTNVTDPEQRVAIVKKKNVCFNCFGNHRVSRCGSKFACLKCGKKHHTSICRNEEPKTKTDMQNENVGDDEIPVVAHANVKSSETSESEVLHSAQESHQEVLLKTAVAPIWYEHENVMANILLDEGAQRSFISENLARMLGIKATGSVTTSISGFGGGDKRIQRLQQASVWLQTEDKRKMKIDVLIVPKIATPLNIRFRSNINKLSYMQGLKLAHPVSNEERFNISMLIGADFYWSIIQDEIIRGEGPTAVKSKLGYLISGPLEVSRNQRKIDTAMMHILSDTSSEVLRSREILET